MSDFVKSTRSTEHQRACIPTTHVAVLFSIYVVLAISIWSERYFFIIKEAFFRGIITTITLSIVCLCIIALFSAGDRPLVRLWRLFKSRSLPGMWIQCLFIVGTSAYTTYKIAIPEIVPFYADDMLATIGQTLHGDYPWRLAHAIFADRLTPYLIQIYLVAWTALWFGLVTFAAFTTDRAKANRYLSAMVLTLIVCGTVLAMVLSSVGPVFYGQFFGDDRFAELIQVLNASEFHRPTLAIAQYLHSNYAEGAPEIGSGISAAPSVHVAIATLNAFFLATLNRWLGVVGWAFAAIIMFASVYTGWHYSADGYISIAVVSLIWWTTGKPGQSAQNIEKAAAAAP